jgi:hypothetical protein
MNKNMGKQLALLVNIGIKLVLGLLPTAPAGLEPATLALTVRCSTIEPRSNNKRKSNVE